MLMVVALFEGVEPHPSPPLIKGGSFALVLKVIPYGFLGRNFDLKIDLFGYLLILRYGTTECPPLIRGGLGWGLTVSGVCT